MKASDIPNHVLDLPATPIPTKVVYDWGALHLTLIDQGFIIIESDEIRVMPSGSEESVPVKAFNSHLRQTKGLCLQTKRIGKTRWFCTL